jgi:hypothetical protein
MNKKGESVQSQPVATDVAFCAVSLVLPSLPSIVRKGTQGAAKSDRFETVYKKEDWTQH